METNKNQISKKLFDCIPTIFDKIVEIHGVKRSDISISCDLSAIYINEVKYSGLSGRDEYKLLEIIEL